MDLVLLAWPTMIVLGLGARIAVRLHYGARGPEPGDPVYIFLNTTSWVLMIVGMVPLLVGSAITYVGLIIVLVAAVTFVESIVEQREAQRRSMCTLLALTAEHGNQLDSSVLLEGQAARGFVGRAVHKLFAALGGGMSMVEAIRRNPRALPRAAVAYAAAGETMQGESQALKELSRSDPNELATVWRACMDRIAYVSVVLLVMAGVFAFLMIKIVPAFQKIFEDFDMELPRMTQWAIAASQFSVHYLAVPIAVGAPLLLFSAGVVGCCYLCDVPVLHRLGDQLFRGRSTADVLRIIAVATESRQSLSAVLSRLASVYPSAATRRRLAPVAKSVMAGEDWRVALYQGRFISQAERSLLGTAQQVGNLPWALRSIAKRNEKRTVYRMAAAIQLIYPCLILLLGGIVGFTVMALFLPLVKLIEGLAR
jgi:type II secretory pathway component PulF